MIIALVKHMADVEHPDVVFRELGVQMRHLGASMTRPAELRVAETIQAASDEQLSLLWEVFQDEIPPGLASLNDAARPRDEASAKEAADGLRALGEEIDGDEYKGVAAGVVLLLILAPVKAAAEALEHANDSWETGGQSTVAESTAKLSLAQKILQYAPGMKALSDLAARAIELIGRAF